MQQLFGRGQYHVQQVDVYGIPLGTIFLEYPLKTAMYPILEPTIEEHSEWILKNGKDQALMAFREASCEACTLVEDCKITLNLDINAMRSVAEPRVVTFGGGHEEEIGGVFPVVAVIGTARISVDLPNSTIHESLTYVAEHALCCSGKSVEDLGDGEGSIGPYSCNIYGRERR